ncbi:MAG TPA: carbohydrate binding domain-containing protein [Pyrinomonadaceae bacterium]|nr:carbohydrate binding domain-containing protein [Pyrinomonadaceae bacterium]
MSEQVKFINVDAAWRRALLLVPAAAALACAVFVVRWCLGNTLAEYPPDVETVRRAARLAPADPQVHYTLAVLARRSFEPDELAESLRRYEQAVALSPNDYRLWQELGRARGQSGDAAGGERALRRSVELAPHYAMPRWYLGNLLLRAGRVEEAFAELRGAAELHPDLRQQVFALAGQVFGSDTRRIAEVAGTNAAMRAQLVEFFVKQKRGDEALAVWSGMSAEERAAQQAAGKSLMRALLDAGRAHSALEVLRGVAPEAARDVAVGRVTNGGFEGDVNTSGENPFGWSVRQAEQVQAGLDARGARGGRSLRLNFSARAAASYSGLSQLVAVEPGARYRLEFFVRTEDLKSASTLLTEVLDGASAEPGRVLGASAPVPAGTNDWQSVAVEFAVPPQSQSVVVRLNRAPCADALCPIFGRIWYDDFSLQRLGAGEAR